MSRVRLDEDGEMYIKVNSKGNNDAYGKEWDDGAGGQVKQICIWYGDLVYGIQVSYERDETSVLSARHGGCEGDFEQIQFDEPITWVSGHYGSWCLEPDIFADEEEAPYNYTQVIRSLKFGTDKATYGPFGCQIGTPFSFKMRTGCAGFHGRSSSNADYGYLEAIGVYVRSLAKSPLVGGSSLSVPPTPPSSIKKEEGEILVLQWVYGMQVSYERNNGTTFSSARHGGTEGYFQQIQFHEPITCVSGYYGFLCWDTVVIRSLTFRKGQATYGPFGREIGTHFSFEMCAGCVLDSMAAHPQMMKMLVIFKQSVCMLQVCLKAKMWHFNCWDIV